MSISDGLQSLLKKNMTRKEFVVVLGLSTVSLLGFSHVIQLLSGKRLLHPASGNDYDYGATNYGGKQ